MERVADGLSDTRSARAKKILPAGALLWAWEANTEFEEVAGQTWLILLPNKYNKQVHYGWRLDPRQLAEDRAAAAACAREGQNPVLKENQVACAYNVFIGSCK